MVSLPRAEGDAFPGFLNEDGSLRLVEWARRITATVGIGHNVELHESLRLDNERQPVAMHGSPATGRGLVSNGFLGVDLIRLGAGQAFAPHTHPGDHLLIVVYGKGTITYNGKIYPTQAGQVYQVEGAVPHAVGAITDHMILAVGAPHKPVGSTERMALVAYREVLAETGDLHCLICDVKTAPGKVLHQLGCKHCPCPECTGAIQMPEGSTP